jgi:hypothetical protein
MRKREFQSIVRVVCKDIKIKLDGQEKETKMDSKALTWALLQMESEKLLFRSRSIFKETRSVLKFLIENIMRDALTYTEPSGTPAARW